MRKPVFVKFRLYPGQDDDLLAWYKELERLPYGAKGQAIKEVLRRGIREGEASSAPASVSLDADAVREAIAAAIAQTLDLGEIRRVVEAAVTSALAAARLNVVEEDADEEEESEETLDMLGDELLL